MKRFEKVARLHQIMRARLHPVPVRTLCEEIECSRATLYRVIDDLILLGAPLDRQSGGYAYGRDAPVFELPGIWFSAAELESLLTVTKLLGNIPPGLVRSRIKPIESKLAQLLNIAIPDGKAFPAHRIRLIPVHARRTEPLFFNRMAQAVVERRQCRVIYSQKTSEPRVLSPQRLVYYRDHWYTDCWDEGKNGLRTFALHRIADIELLDERAREIGEKRLDSELTGGYGIFAGKPKHRARLLFSAERARLVAGEEWHPDQQARHLPDGQYEIEVPYANHPELLSEILRHGAHVRVLAPESLVALVRESLLAANEMYA